MKDCPICNSNQNYYNKYQHWGWPGVNIFNNLEISSCSICGFSYVLDEPSPNDLNNFYEKFYRAESAPFYYNYNSRYIETSTPPLRSIAQIYAAMNHVNFYSGDVFLDIGPGPGDSFFAANKLLKAPKLISIEPNDGAKAYYKENFNVKSYDNFFQIKSNEEQKCKIILFSHSLEHFSVNDLTSTFNSIKEVIDIKNGILVIEVPHVDFRIHKEFRYPDTPHLLFFSKDSLIQLLKSNNFDICCVQILGEKYPYKKYQLPNILNQNNNLEVQNVNLGSFYSLIYKFFLKFKTLVRIYLKVKNIFKKSEKNREINLDPFYSNFINDDNFDTIRIVTKLSS